MYGHENAQKQDRNHPEAFVVFVAAFDTDDLIRAPNVRDYLCILFLVQTDLCRAR